MKNSSSLLGLLLALSAQLFSPEAAFAQDFPTRMEKKKPAPSDTAVTIAAGTGLGTFQDVQVPVNEDVQLRGDGLTPAEENSSHLGLPVHAALGYRVNSGKFRFVPFRLEVLQMRALTGPAATQSSSYSRIGITAEARYFFTAINGGWYATAGLNLRRSAFSNISHSHYLESAVTRGGLGYSSADWDTEVFAAVAPYASFGYSDGKIMGGEEFKTGKSSLTEVGASMAWRIRDQVWFVTSAEQELISTTIGDVSEYDGFGLTVTPTSVPSRTYELATTTVRIGLRKEF